MANGDRQLPAGPGRFSRRTDRQPIRQVDLDRPDVQYGDVERFAEAQRTAPVPARGGPRSATPPAPTRPGTPGELPPFLTELDSSFPAEPVTAGLEAGPGAGPESLTLGPQTEDIRELTLAYLARVFDNADAHRMLFEIQASRVPQASIPTPRGGTVPPSETPAATGEGEFMGEFRDDIGSIAAEEPVGVPTGPAVREETAPEETPPEESPV